MYYKVETKNEKKILVARVLCKMPYWQPESWSCYGIFRFRSLRQIKSLCKKEKIDDFLITKVSHLDIASPFHLNGEHVNELLSVKEKKYLHSFKKYRCKLK